jgi:two-component system, NtrC family, response regulator GlrR
MYKKDMSKGCTMANGSNHYMKTILLVDDNPHTLDLYCESLNELGFEITKATNDASAIKELENMHYDLVVTDLKMDHIDGISILKRAKTLDPGTMVIITTGNTSVIKAIDASCFHADDYILKPFDAHYLAQRVLNCISQSSAALLTPHPVSVTPDQIPLHPEYYLG